MSFLVFIILALIEYIILIFIKNEIITLKYEGFNIGYTNLTIYDPIKEKPYGVNVVINLLFPTIYIIIVSGIFYKIGLKEYVNNIFLVTLIYFILRFIDIIVIRGRGRLYYWNSEIKCFLLSFLLSICIYYSFIIKTDKIFIPLEQLRDGIWIAIFTFMFSLCWKYMQKKFVVNYKKDKDLKISYILNQYTKFKEKYQKMIVENDKQNGKIVNNLVYSIMIYENFNRPKIIRILENIKFLCCKHATLGIMQIETKYFINDKESVILGSKKIRNDYLKYKNIEDVIRSYNGGKDYLAQVLYIYNIIDSI